jgi:hypothetical protein
MAFARVVQFEGVPAERMAQMKQQIEEGDRPDNIPATEIVVLHEPESEKALAILFFETEDDYRTGDAALNAMDRGDTPGRRADVTKYTVGVHRMA